MTTTLVTRPFADVDRLFRDLWTVRPNSGSEGYTPAADVRKDGEDLVASFDLPGIDPAEITVEVQGRRLVVRGERKDEHEGSDDRHRVREVRYGSFARTVALPRAADADSITARYDAGVLTVTVAGAFAGTTPQRIEITSAAA